jgi:hypothetical protein
MVPAMFTARIVSGWSVVLCPVWFLANGGNLPRSIAYDGTFLFTLENGADREVHDLTVSI